MNSLSEHRVLRDLQPGWFYPSAGRPLQPLALLQFLVCPPQPQPFKDLPGVGEGTSKLPFFAHDLIVCRTPR